MQALMSNMSPTKCIPVRHADWVLLMPGVRVKARKKKNQRLVTGSVTCQWLDGSSKMREEGGFRISWVSNRRTLHVCCGWSSKCRTGGLLGKEPHTEYRYRG